MAAWRGTAQGTIRVSGKEELRDGWELCHCSPGDLAGPEELADASLQWRIAKVPGTVASAIHEDLDESGPYDASDWWYRNRFAVPVRTPGARYYLRFYGLATLAQVWLNGQAVLASQNMFVGHKIDVTALLRDSNALVIRFASLESALARKRARPRWRTALVNHQGLRWFRTTLLGRIPGWTPPIVPVGPWGPVTLECVEHVEVVSLNLQSRAVGTTGHLHLDAVTMRADGKPLEGARLRVGENLHALEIDRESGTRVRAELVIENVSLWWPHTHGTPHLLPCLLEFQVKGSWIAIDCGMVGFKEVSLDTGDGRVQFVVNGIPVFCRGAVWTTMDILALRGESASLRRALETARDAGINMLRVGGTMTYESDDFYRLCDEFGILVWQDFMFANMDYPLGDAAFLSEAESEVRFQLDRLHRHACIAAYCGSSEIAQQAAMMGIPAEGWLDPFFLDALPAHCARAHGDIPYFPSTPWGGAMPFHVGSGLAHYWGTGAYRRPLTDPRTARVKFTPECLGFSNVPEPETMALVFDGAMPPPHHPRWKSRVPRDSGAGWDFEDIRDHYLGVLFGCDPVALRSQDIERYYAISRIAPGEVMKGAFSHWRSPGSGCGGGLVWFYQDLLPGAGWGILDSTGRPKAAYWCLRRAWAARTVLFTDEGLDGLAVHVLNDSPDAFDATMEISMYREGRVRSASAHAEFRVPARGGLSHNVDSLVGQFTDCTNAYRFGPPRQDVVAVRMLRPGTSETIAQDCYFPLGLDLASQRGAEVHAEPDWRADGAVVVTLRTNAFLQSVAISCQGWRPDDNHFHLAPDWDKQLVFVPISASDSFRADFQALNLGGAIPVRSRRPATLVAARQGPA
jgi:beta-mannosidase